MNLFSRHILYYTIEGGITGFVIGLALSAVFVLLSTLLVYSGYGTSLLADSWQTIIMLGVIPSMIIGPLTGLLTGLFVSWKAKSYSGAAWIGGVITGVLCLPWFYIGLVLTLMAPFGFIALPTCLTCIVAGSWIGQRIYQRQNAQNNAESDDASRVPIYPFARGFVQFSLIITLILISMYIGINYLAGADGQVTERHQMYWSNQPYGRCSTYVELEFVAASGYVIATCSPELLSALEEAKENPIEVTVDRLFTAGAWRYEIKQVGTWTGELEFHGIALHCHSLPGQQNLSMSDRPCGKGNVPFRQPYRLE